MSELEALLLILFIVVGSFLTIWLYRKITGGITTRKEQREATRVGRMGVASEKKEIKR